MTADMRVGVVTDSTADIPIEMLESYAIEMIPALLIIDGKTFEDGRQLSRADFYSNLPDYKEPPTTATPSPSAFITVYDRLLAKGSDHIISIHVASTLSGMITAASQAASEFHGRVHVIDSGQLSLGLGFQAIEIGRAALEGRPLDQLMAVADRVRSKVRVAALIHTLEYLRRSGRVTWLQAGFGDLLKVKQLLGVQDSSIENLGKARTFDRALQQLLQLFRSWGNCARLAVLHTGIPELATEIAKGLQNHTHEPPIVVDVTTIIGAHTGPGSLGLAALTT